MCILSGLNSLQLVLFCFFHLIELFNCESLGNVYTKECYGTKDGFAFKSEEHIDRYRIYEAKYMNCTNVRGNLEITWIELTDDQFDFSFLENIREVDGYVLIVGNFVSRIRLTRLRVIRGLALYEGFSLYVEKNSNPKNSSIGLEELQLPSLVEVLEGNILIANNSRLCFGENTIDWTHILMNNRQGRLVRSANPSPYCASVASCHENCSSENGKRFCWGLGADMCQTINRCKCDRNQRCSVDGECCDEECIAGCSDVKQCMSCRNFARGSSECVVDCGKEIRRKGLSGFEMVVPDDKYAHGSKCVKECEAGFVAQDGYCVSSCNSVSMVRENNTKLCVPCEGKCPDRCKGTNKVFGTDWLHKDHLPIYSRCTIIDGDLSILQVSFKGHHLSTGKEISVDDLEALSGIREITGILRIEVNDSEFTSLNFLRNLQVIGGVGATHGFSLIIQSTSLTSLELNSLQRVEKGVYIRNNTDLCYANGINWTTVTNGKILIKGNKNKPICEDEGFNCSSTCLSSNGCMGRGEKSCITCPHFFQSMDQTCSLNCSTEKGFYVKEGTRGNSECRPCDKQCTGSCTGDGPGDCFNCSNVKHQDVCLAQCPPQMYPDTRRICQPCNSQCNQCTGNSSVVGLGGCSDCNSSTIRYDDDGLGQCIKSEDECDRSLYFVANGYVVKLPSKTKPLSQMTACLKCHPECNGCTGKKPSECKVCRNYRQISTNDSSECVRNCSDAFYDAGSSQCLPCHPECSGGCSGPEAYHCVSCRNVRVRSTQLPEFKDDDSIEYESICAEDCPKGLYREKKENETDFTCVEMTSAKEFMKPSTAIPVFVALFFVIFVGLVIFVVIWRKQKLRRLRENILAIDQIPMLACNAKPDMSLLRLIKESELRKGNVIGSGAFGTVFKGVWIPDKENVKIPVAIKVLQETSNTNLNVELLDEARIMASVCHPYCVRILAVCMTAQMMLITQLMPLGCLLDYVRKEKSNIGSRALLLWSVQIAKGMKHLESLGIVHRDLAARNVLVHNPNQVKITDFGLAKLLGYEEDQIHSEGGKMPIKWLALECIQHRIYTHKSDVWSYGVTLWEMFSYGSRPYENLQARQIPQALEKGERLPQPSICTIDVYMILIKCWMLDIDSRPTFSDLAEEFTRMAADPGRFLVIPGDRLMRLPSQAPDTKDLIRLMSLPVDEPDLMIVSGEEYLKPLDLDIETSDGFSPPCSSPPLGPLRCIPEDATYENNCELTEERRKMETEDDVDGKSHGQLTQQYSRERCQRYISDPCRTDSDLEVNKYGKATDNGPTTLRVDEDGYLPPQSATALPVYLDVVYQSTGDNTETSPKPHQYMDMNSCIGTAKDNPEYFDDEGSRLTDEIMKTNRKNTSTGHDRQKTKDSEYYNVNHKPLDLPPPYKRLPESDI